MSVEQFEQFKGFLELVIQDVDVVRKNATLQDDAYMQNVLARVRSLTTDVSFVQDYTDVYSALGLLIEDDQNRVVRFDPKGFVTTLSAYREGIVAEPRQLWVHAGTDDIRYLLADGGGGSGLGVFMLNQDLEVVRRFPGYGGNVGAGEYEDSSAVATFTIGGTEYIAIACASRQVVQIYEYADPYTYMGTIGTLDTPGAGTDLLTTPNGIAVDETNELMYISCPTGQPAGATASNGFVAVYDVSPLATPGPPVFSSIPLFYSGTGALLDSQVYTPTSLFWDAADSIMWIVNQGDNTVGAFNFSGTAPLCTRFIEQAGPGYTLRSPTQIYKRTMTGGFTRLYVSNSVTGTIEEFDGRTFQHLDTYGIRASEDNVSPSYQRLSPDVYGALGNPVGVVADTVMIDGQDTNVLIVTDDLNKRVQRFNLDVYTTDNFVNFRPITHGVPFIVDGWTVSGTIPLDMVSMEYRFDETEQYRTLPSNTSLESTKKIMFRLRVQLDHRKFIRGDWAVERIRVHGRQA